MHSHLRGSGRRHPFPSRLLQKAVCQRPALHKALASTYTFKPIYTVIIPVMIPLPSVLLLEVCLLQPYLSKVSSFSNTADFPFNTADLPLGRVPESCLLSSATLFKHAEIMRKNMVVFSLRVSFPFCPLGSTDFMQSFRLLVFVLFCYLSHKISFLVSFTAGADPPTPLQVATASVWHD